MLALDEATHTYTFDGAAVPSVSEILAPLFDWSRVPPAVLERKRQIGDAVHKAIALDLAGDLDESSIEPVWAGYFEGWRRFMRESGFTLLWGERRLFDPALRFAGTPDLFGILKNREVLIDTKNTHALHPAVGPQTAAYDMLRLANSASGKPAKRYALQLAPDGSPRLHPLTEPGDMNTFIALLVVHNFKRKHGL